MDPGGQTTPTRITPRRLRHKLIGGLLIITLSLSSVLTALLGHFSLKHYKQLEEANARQQVEQAVGGLTQMHSRLAVLAMDWAKWDDAYAYVQHPDRAFVDSNMGGSTFEVTGVDLIVILDADNNILAAQGYDLGGPGAGWSADATDYARQMLAARGAMIPAGLEPGVGSMEQVHGIVPYDGWRWMVASQPVIRSDGSGPAKGRLVFCARIDDDSVAELQDLLQLNVSINPPRKQLGDQSIWFDRDGLATIRSHTNVSCMTGSPALCLTVENDRRIYQAGLDGLYSVALTCLAGGVLIALILGVLLERLVIRRLERLSTQSRVIGQPGQTGRFQASGRDEIATLAQSMNTMLDRLDQSRRELERTQHTVDLAGSAIFWLTPEGRFRYVNAAACELAGCTAEQLIGQHLATLAPVWTPEHWAQHWNWFRRMDPRVFETTCRRKNGEVFEAEARCSRMFVDDQEFLFTILTDISDRKAAERRLVEMATTDQLTGLPNRAWLLERLGRIIRQGPSTADRAALLFLDLDRFKLINDAMGHTVGDQLIRAFAERVTGLFNCFNHTDCPCCETHMVRLGGDEFVILVEQHAGDTDMQTAASGLAEQIVGLLNEPFILNGHSVVSTTSIGVVAGLSTYDRPDAALRDADTAMYAAKHEGRNTVRVFNATMHDAVVQRVRLEHDLRQATRTNAFELHYQPIIDLQTNELHGFEALLRWERPDGSPIDPADFIPIAEETGLIVSIGAFVLERACTQLALWASAFPGLRLTMAVNISRRQLIAPGLLDMVQRLLDATGVDPTTLEFEITEGVLIENLDDANRTLQDLRGLGIRLSMDDFGTGYSSLSCLHEFPIQVLKIDRAFVANMSMNIEYSAITHAIITLAHNLGATVIAEGIEDRGQLAQLQALDCDYGQGYLFSKAMPPDQAHAWLAERYGKGRRRAHSA